MQKKLQVIFGAIVVVIVLLAAGIYTASLDVFKGDLRPNCPAGCFCVTNQSLPVPGPNICEKQNCICDPSDPNYPTFTLKEEEEATTTPPCVLNPSLPECQPPVAGPAGAGDSSEEDEDDAAANGSTMEITLRNNWEELQDSISYFVDMTSKESGIKPKDVPAAADAVADKINKEPGHETHFPYAILTPNAKVLNGYDVTLASDGFEVQPGQIRIRVSSVSEAVKAANKFDLGVTWKPSSTLNLTYDRFKSLSGTEQGFHSEVGKNFKL